MNFYKLILYYEKNYSNMCKDKLKIYFYIPNTQTGRIISDFFRHALSILMLFYLILVFFGLVVPIHILKSCLACQHISAFFLNLLFFFSHSVYCLRFGIVTSKDKSQLTVIQFQE